jgi:hypothetical protein
MPAVNKTPYLSLNQWTGSEKPKREDFVADNLAIDEGISDMLKLKWDLVQSYTTAGSFTWTAPDLYGDGRAYEIGIFIIGAGGSGAAYKYYSNSANGASVSGGASGRTKMKLMTVTPGATYNVVVGAGGAIVSRSAWGTSLDGNAGGSSAFNGVTAAGGAGGLVYTGATTPYGAQGAPGGQGSDAIMAANATNNGCQASASAMGYPPSNGEIPLSTALLGGKSVLHECFNPFAYKRILGAGGGSSVYSTTAFTQTVPTLDDGLVAGLGACTRVTTTDTTVTASPATSPGSGGGAALLVSHNASQPSATGTVNSGKGADGGVMLYVRRPAA